MRYPVNYSGYKFKRREYCISKTLHIINIDNELKGILMHIMCYSHDHIELQPMRWLQSGSTYVKQLLFFFNYYFFLRELKQETRTLILVMEYGSIDLAGFLRKNRSKMTKADRQVFWQQMLEAVHLVHQQGIIHRDLKPANFLMVDGRLKLIDFGIAHTLQVSIGRF